MGVISPDPLALITHKALISYPDISLDIFQHVPDMQGAIGIGEGACDQYTAAHQVFTCVLGACGKTGVSHVAHACIVTGCLVV